MHQGNITAEISFLTMHVIGYQRETAKAVPNIALYNHVHSQIIIEFKDDRYRVTLRSIKLTPKENSTNVVDLEAIAFRGLRAKFNDTFINRRSKIMDYTFQRITNFNEIEQKDNW